MLPEDPSKSAKNLSEDLSKALNKDISIIISDSMTRPYRSGVINFALASHNLPSLIDLKGKEDMYGNKLKGTEVAVADELASASGLLMGQANEMKPVILVKGFNKSSYEVNNNFPNDLVYIPTNRRELNKFDFSREILIIPTQVKEALNVN